MAGALPGASSHELTERFARDGFFVLRQALLPQQVQSLRRVCDRLTDDLRAEPESGETARSRGFINDPKLHRGRPEDVAVLLDAAAHPVILGSVRAAVPDEPWTFALLEMLFDPLRHTHGGRGNWHKGPPSHSPRFRYPPLLTLLCRSRLRRVTGALHPHPRVARPAG